MTEFLESLEEISWQNKVIASILVLSGVFFWYLASQPELATFANYYLNGVTVGLSFYAGHLVTKGEWVNVGILWQGVKKGVTIPWVGLKVPFFILVIIVVAYLWLFLFLPLSATQGLAPDGLAVVDSNQLVLLGVPALGSMPMDPEGISLAGMTLEGRLTMGLAGAIESTDWLLLYGTLILVSLNLFFLLFVPSRFNITAKEYLKTPKTYITKYYTEGSGIEKVQVIAVLVIIVVSMSVVSGWMVSSWHMANYSSICSTKGLTMEQCNAIFKRAELFGITGNLLSYGTGSGFIAITAHFVNNLVASYG